VPRGLRVSISRSHQRDRPSQLQLPFELVDPTTKLLPVARRAHSRLLVVAHDRDRRSRRPARQLQLASRSQQLAILREGTAKSPEVASPCPPRSTLFAPAGRRVVHRPGCAAPEDHGLGEGARGRDRPVVGGDRCLRRQASAPDVAGGAPPLRGRRDERDRRCPASIASPARR